MALSTCGEGRGEAHFEKIIMANAFFMIKYSLLVILFYATGVSAQYATPAVALSHYVLDSFTKGKVLLKSGAVSEQTLNYNILTGEMIFDAGGRYLAIAEPQNVDTVFIQDRQFVPLNARFYELLTHTAAPLFVEFTYTVEEPGASLGYGTTSNTTAATALKTVISTGGAYGLKLPDEFKVKPGYTYWILKEGKYQKANNAQQLNKIFPDKKRIISDWMKKTGSDFSKRKNIIALVQMLEPEEATSGMYRL